MRVAKLHLVGSNFDPVLVGKNVAGNDVAGERVGPNEQELKRFFSFAIVPESLEVVDRSRSTIFRRAEIGIRSERQTNRTVSKGSVFLRKRLRKSAFDLGLGGVRFIKDTDVADVGIIDLLQIFITGLAQQLRYRHPRQ